jgi:hypothetical protein
LGVLPYILQDRKPKTPEGLEVSEIFDKNLPLMRFGLKNQDAAYGGSERSFMTGAGFPPP